MVGEMFICTPWSNPLVLKKYKYKGYVIEYIEQSCHDKCSVYWHHEFRAFKDGELVTRNHRRYSDCIYELKKITENGKQKR